MILGGRSLNDLSLDDFRALVDNQIPEGPHLDYKQTAYSGRESDRREMLRDITSLANAEGGYLLLGIEEDGTNRPSAISPIDDAESLAQAIRQTCLDSIQDRIEGLEVRAYETGFNQGIIAVRIPPSGLRPHMVTLGHRTDFFRRYDTDKRPMTITEIREVILGNERFRRLIELELQSRGELRHEGVGPAQTFAPPYARILTQNSVESFLQRYFVGTKPAVLVIVSPYISDLAGTRFQLQDLVEKIGEDQTWTYVITRPPQEAYQQAGMTILEKSPYVEIRHNPDIHAKLYVSWNRNEKESFAMFGSGNLTTRGLLQNLELGMMIYPHGYGRTLVRELYQWGNHTVRTMSRRIKPITARRRI